MFYPLVFGLDQAGTGGAPVRAPRAVL
jgi:hypothetical protein